MNSNPSDYDQILESLHQSLFEINCKMESIVHTMKLLGEKNRMDKLAERVLHELEQNGPKSVSELDRKLGTGIAPIQIVLDQLIKQLVVKVKSKRTYYSEGDSVNFYSLNWELWMKTHDLKTELPLESSSWHELMTWIHDIGNSKTLSETELIELLKFTCNQLHDYIATLNQLGDISSANRVENRVKAMLSHFESVPGNDYPDW